MTTGTMAVHPRTAGQPVYRKSIVWRVVLGCGILSSLLYIATDLLGVLRYDGYSFTSQAISELAAIGAPSKSFVDQLFLGYDFLALLFGVGVLHEAGRNRRLRITGALLIAFGGVGLVATMLAGPDFFAMHRRGTGNFPSDVRHIILTGVLVTLWLFAMGFAAFALGRRFRVYTVTTLVIVVVLSVVTAPYAARLAAGLPTPGLGIVERVAVYAPLLWMAVLAITLLRRSSRHAAVMQL